MNDISFQQLLSDWLTQKYGDCVTITADGSISIRLIISESDGTLVAHYYVGYIVGAEVYILHGGGCNMGSPNFFRWFDTTLMKRFKNELKQGYQMR